MKIVFIPNMPYNKRDHVRYGVQYFLEKGYDVEVLDLNKLMYPGFKEKISVEYWTFEFYSEVNNFEEVLNKIKDLNKNDFIFFYTASDEATLLLNKMRTKTNAKFITYVGGSIPPSFVSCNLVESFRMKLKAVKNKLFTLPNKKFNTDVYVSGSKKDEKLFSKFIGENTIVLKGHSRDYNLCLNVSSEKKSESYCVYLDSDVIDACEFTLWNIEITADKGKYYTKLLKYLHWMEDMFNLKVIIAAHPRTRKYRNIDEIDGIEIVHGKTAELVKEAKFILNEGSTAVSYAVIFNKPMFFFTSDEIGYFYRNTCAFAKAFNKNIIRIDELSQTIINQIKFDLENISEYNKYKKDYLTYTDNGIETFELIDDFFKKHVVK